ncbi:MAG: hypothetical protein WKF83_04665 [Nocardioidaceae bacterium]
MALITIASAKGSPGVTTAALALGGLWPRPVIVAECDPAGGDIALRMPAADGQVLDLQTGLLSLVAAGRKSLQPDLVRQHTQTIVGGLEILAGVNLPEQNAALTHQWALFGPLFAEVEDFDVIADLGRIGAMTPQNNLLGSAQAIAMVVDTTPATSCTCASGSRTSTPTTAGRSASRCTFSSTRALSAGRRSARSGTPSSGPRTSPPESTTSRMTSVAPTSSRVRSRATQRGPRSCDHSCRWQPSSPRPPKATSVRRRPQR